jgi:hypothetical protein
MLMRMEIIYDNDGLLAVVVVFLSRICAKMKLTISKAIL